MALKVGTLFGLLELDANPFLKGLDDAKRRGGGKASEIGDEMTKKVTLPLVAAGGAAVKMGMDFDTSFSRMVGLAGVPAGEIDKLKESVLQLAGDTARPPQELADALYEAASAGLNSAQAMDAVKVAAQGAAAGMGDTGDIVGLIASATASYGAEAIDAAKATDILTATIRAGRADPQELAGTLGRVLPIASQLNVSFDEVGGAVAYLSNVFGDTNRTVTATQGVLTKLLSPSEQGRKVLEEMGTSVEELHKRIDQDGLLGALDLLREKGFEGNQEAIAKLFDDIEGRQGALALLADESGTLAETLDQTAGSAGALAEALGEATGTDGHKAKQAFVDLQVAAIQAADAIMPFVTAVVSGVSDVVGAFSSLPDPAQKAIVGVVGLMAAMGPMMSIGGRLAKNWEAISKGWDAASGAASTLAGKISLVQGAAVALAAVAVGTAVNRWRSEMNEAESDAESMADMFMRSFRAPVSSMDDFHGRLQAIGREIAERNRAGDQAMNPFLKERHYEMADALQAELDVMLAQESKASDLQRQLGLTADEALQLATNEDRLAAATDPATGKLDEQKLVAYDAAAAQEELEAAIEGVTNAMRAHLDPLFAAQDAMLSHRDAQDAVKEAEWQLAAAMAERDRAVRDHGEGSAEAMEAALNLLQAEEDLDVANRNVSRSALDVATAATELKARVEDGSVSIEAAEQQLRRWVDQGLITEQQAYDTSQELRGVAGAADSMGGDIRYTLSLESQQFWAGIAAARAALGSVQVTAQLGGSRTAGPQLWSGGPVAPGNDYIVGEHGPELLRMTGGAGVIESAPATRQALGGSGDHGGVGGARSVTYDIDVSYPPDTPSTQAISHELHMIELGNP